MKIIKRAQSENRQKGVGVYYEDHHILPKSIFPLWKLKKENMVLLTAREHFFCHQLLDKIYPKSGMFFGLWRLANDGQNNYCIKGSKEYEKLKIRFCELQKGQIISSEMKQQISQTLKQYYKEHEHPRGMLGKHTTENCKKRASEFHSQTIWITNREINKKIMKWEEIPEGFEKGKTYSKESLEKVKAALSSHSNKGRKQYTNGIKDISIFGDPPEGYWKGRSRIKTRS
jgi:hypothetical protein